MATLTIRRVDPAVVERLKSLAKHNGRSVEEEVRVAISRAAGASLGGPAAVEHFAAMRKAIFRDRVFPDSTPLLRELRDADPTCWDGE